MGKVVSTVGGEGSALVCTGCGMNSDDMWMVGDTDAEWFAALIEHAMYSHAGRQDVTLHRHVTTITSFELAILLDLPAVTDSEQAWRDEQEPWKK